MVRTVYIKEKQTVKTSGGIMDAYLKCMNKNNKPTNQKVKSN